MNNDTDDNVVKKDINNSEQIITEYFIENNEPKKKIFGKTSITIIIFSFIIFSIIMIYTNNYIFKIYPKTALPIAYNKTISQIHKETKEISEVIKTNTNTADLKYFNKFLFSFYNLDAEIRYFDGLTKAFLNFNDSLKINIYLDDFEYLININNSPYYEITKNNIQTNMDNENSIAKNTYNAKKIIPKYRESTDSSDIYIVENDDEVAYVNYILNAYENNSYSNELNRLINNGYVITYDKDHMYIDVDYDATEFENIILSSVSKLNSQVFDLATEFVLQKFIKKSNLVHLSYTIDNSGALKNVIRDVEFTTDANSNYFRITSNDNKYLLKDIDLSYKIFKNANTVSLKNNIDALNFSINNYNFNISVASNTDAILVYINNKQFLKISDDLSVAQKPIISKPISELSLLKSTKINFKPLTEFFDYITDLLT